MLAYHIVTFWFVLGFVAMVIVVVRKWAEFVRGGGIEMILRLVVGILLGALTLYWALSDENADYL